MRENSYSSTREGQWECHLDHNNSYKTTLSQSTWQTGMVTPILCIAVNKVMNTKLYIRILHSSTHSYVTIPTTRMR